MDFIFQSSLLIIPRLLAGPHLWVGAVIRADDRCAQLFRHLPGQQTVNGSFSRAPRASIDEDHQRRRPIVQPAHVGREVQVQFLAPAAKCDALQSVHSIRAFSIHAHRGKPIKTTFRSVLTHLFIMLFVFGSLVPGLQLEVKSPVLEIFETFQHSFGHTIDPSVERNRNKAVTTVTESKFNSSFRNYLGFNASMYFLYPGLFGQP